VQTFADRDRLDFVRVLQYEFPSQVARQDPPAVLKGPPVTSKPVEATAPEAPKPGAAKPATPPVGQTIQRSTAPGVIAPPAAQLPKPAAGMKPKKPVVAPTQPITPAPGAVPNTSMRPIPDPAETEEEAPPPPSDITPGIADTPGTE
jgi:translation initiation factor IF-2